jgi:hypothetical protein
MWDGPANFRDSTNFAYLPQASRLEKSISIST